MNNFTVAADGTVSGVSASASPVTISATAQGVSAAALVSVGAPGTWSGAVAMRSFVDVEGSGDDTIITSTAPLGVAIYGPGTNIPEAARKVLVLLRSGGVG